VGCNCAASIAQIFERIRSDRSPRAEIAAKDAALAAKDSQIETLRELTSVRVREHYLATKTQLEDYIEKLKRQIEGLESAPKTVESRAQSLESDARLSRVFHEMLDQTREWLKVVNRDYRELAGEPHEFDHSARGAAKLSAELDRTHPGWRTHKPRGQLIE